MNEATKKIKELREEIARINTEIRKLERENSNFYIGVRCYGNGDYWDEYYSRLGFITEDKAKTWCSECYEEEDIHNASYFEVTKEIYDKFGSWYNLDRLNYRLKDYDPIIGKLEGFVSFKESVDKAIKDLTKEIGIEFLSFMYIAKDEYL